MDNIFKTVWDSCTSFAFYRKVTGLSLPQCLKYIVPFCLIIGALIYVTPGLELLRASRQFQEWEEENLPEIRIVDGQLSIDAPQPCYLEPAGILVLTGQEGKTRNLKLALDTTGEIESIEQAGDADILFLSDKMIVRNPDGIMVLIFRAVLVPLKGTMLLDTFHDITIDKERVNKYLPGITWAMVVLPFVITVIAKPVQALIYSLIGMMAAARGGRRIVDFKGVYNICLFATIPATIVSAIIQLLPIYFHPLYLMIFYSFVVVVFTIGAISNLSQQT